MENLKELPYTKISSEEQYNKYCKILSDLIFNYDSGENKLVADHIELLSLLIQEWNDKQYNGKEYDPVALVKSLMEDHGLNQQDVASISDVSKSFVSEVLNYKKYISKKMIRRLANHFKIRQDALNKPYKLEKQVVYLVESQQIFLESNKPKSYQTFRRKKFGNFDREILPRPNDGILNLKIVGDC